uniref:Uncharacterized protein n=1 Tax=Acanthochromis polyacanthus TaxID=80966 RepID=A0A3Q1G2A5_9TELE
MMLSHSFKVYRLVFSLDALRALSHQSKMLNLNFVSPKGWLTMSKYASETEPLICVNSR